jgi:group I intron endonuclease
MVKCGIYKIVSKNTNRIYIGSSSNIVKRWNTHINNLLNNKHHSIKLQRHFNKYGIDDLLFSIIEECSIESLLNKEQYYLDNNYCYFNICKNARNCSGRIPWNKGMKMSKEFSTKMSIIGIGNKNRIGKTHSIETINKIRNSSKNRIFKTKLSDIEINEIKLKYIPKKYNSLKLAKEYNVSKSTILKIIHKV